MFTDLLLLIFILGLIFFVSVSLLIWDNQRFFKRELAKDRVVVQQKNHHQ